VKVRVRLTDIGVGSKMEVRSLTLVLW